jgi:hypothetical protein
MILFWFQQEIKDKDNFYELVHVYKIYETIFIQKVIVCVKLPILNSYWTNKSACKVFSNINLFLEHACIILLCVLSVFAL